MNREYKIVVIIIFIFITIVFLSIYFIYKNNKPAWFSSTLKAQSQNIFCLNSSIVKNILVKKGDIVNQGDGLLVLFINADKKNFSLKEYIIRSKIDGRVDDILCKEGQLLGSDTKLMVIKSTNKFSTLFKIDKASVSKIHLNSIVTAQLSELNNRDCRLIVKNIKSNEKDIYKKERWQDENAKSDRIFEVTMVPADSFESFRDDLKIKINFNNIDTKADRYFNP